MFKTTQLILAKLNTLLENLEFLRTEHYHHGDKLRDIDFRTTRILERQAETEVRPTALPREGEYISEGTLAKLRTQLGVPRSETNPGAYPHKLEEDYSRALRRYYEYNSRPYDGPMDQPYSDDPYPPPPSLEVQNGQLLRLAEGYGRNVSLAQSQGQTGTDAAMAYNSNLANSSVFSMPDPHSATNVVATDELFGYSGVRPVQEG